MTYHETTIIADYPIPIIYGDDPKIAEETYDMIKGYPRAKASTELSKILRDGISYSVCWREELRAPPADARDIIRGIFVVTVVVSANVDQCL